ncbi:MAG: carbohydrate ABC transporter permease [Proteobacteria bacterium]|nr:carbohydrate ABC transporter permease [Pseudomonadota bacterium]MBI3496646.1 carbohydrate ABC transporter permease [Pseudomonadota bacterium]
MRPLLAFLARTRDGRRVGWVDAFSYLYLALGVFLMFGPVAWLVLSSFKSQADLVRFPPSLLPHAQETVTLAGFDQKLPLFRVTLPDGSEKTMAQLRRIGLRAEMVDPENPKDIVRVDIDQRREISRLHFEIDNYLTPLERFNFLTYFKNSVVVTVVATLLTLLVNSMAAFALSKYRFRGAKTFFVVMIGTLMIPITVVLVPVYLVVAKLGLINNLWGVILPGAATPTGVFLLRQYMLTIPDELIEAARMDAASEWRIYWRIMLPLSAPALAVLAIFSVVWRWNDFLWPLVVLSRSEVFTLQVGLNAFQGELNTQWHYLLAMTVVTLLPITAVFAFLQRYITTGIAATGMK